MKSENEKNSAISHWDCRLKPSLETINGCLFKENRMFFFVSNILCYNIMYCTFIYIYLSSPSIRKGFYFYKSVKLTFHYFASKLDIYRNH